MVNQSVCVVIRGTASYDASSACFGVAGGANRSFMVCFYGANRFLEMQVSVRVADRENCAIKLIFDIFISSVDLLYSPCGSRIRDRK